MINGAINLVKKTFFALDSANCVSFTHAYK